MAKQYDLFISYDEANLPIARLLQAFLEKDVFTASYVYVAQEDLSVATGDNWYDKIRMVLNECKFILPIISPSSIVNRWVLFEAGAGLPAKRTIPLVTSEIPLKELPDQFRPLQCKQLDTDGLIDLCRALRKPLEYNAIPRSFAKVAEKLSRKIDEIVSTRRQFHQTFPFPNRGEMVSQKDRFCHVRRSVWMSGNTLETVTSTLGRLRRELEKNSRGRCIRVELMLPSLEEANALHVAAALDDAVLSPSQFKQKLESSIAGIKNAIKDCDYAELMKISLYEAEYPSLHHYFAVDADGADGPGYIWIDLVKYAYLSDESPHFPVIRNCPVTGSWFRYFQGQWEWLRERARETTH